jgi:hypothetical protein
MGALDLFGLFFLLVVCVSQAICLSFAWAVWLAGGQMRRG